MTNKNFDNNDPSFRPEAAVGTEETPGTPGASESRENKNLLSPRGRIGRWTFALVWITATILNTFLIELSNIFVEPNEAMILLAVIVAVGLVSVFAAIKRCRDAGIATAWAMLAFLPLFNFLLFFYLVWKPAKDAVRSEQSGRRETPTANRPARGARTDETVVNVWDCDWDRDSEAARRLPAPPASSASASSLDERVRESGRLQGEWEAERANAFMDGIGARLKSLFPGLAGGGADRRLFVELRDRGGVRDQLGLRHRLGARRRRLGGGHRPHLADSFRKHPRGLPGFLVPVGRLRLVGDLLVHLRLPLGRRHARRDAFPRGEGRGEVMA